jgi:UDP-2,3-diacylglucosamine pyrophosphatase LpxH
VKRIIISDLHIGSAYCKEEELLKFLNELECDEIILAGDIVDFVKVPIFSELSLMILQKIVTFPRVIYIIGNHDYSFDAFAGKSLNHVEFKEMYEFEETGRTFRVEHGDRYEKGFWSKFAEGVLLKFVSICQDWLERTFKVDLATWWANKALAKRKLIRLWDIIDFNNDVDVAIMGHSHRPEVVIWVDHNEQIKTYVNTGDWVQHTTYAQIVDGVVRLKSYKKTLDDEVI